jgi:CheY-like chemotaxis protein
LSPEKPENPSDKTQENPDDMDLIKIDNNSIEKTEEMKRYEKETHRYSIWRGMITEGFKKWQRGEKIYHREKERISLYVSDDTKTKWLEYTKNDGTTISKLIREAVESFIESQGNRSNHNLSIPQTISNISHTLKEPLTSIKGYSQLLIENYREKLNDQVLETVKNIFEQSILLEKKIINILDNIKVEPEHEVLLIEDDLATIRLIKSYFESKGIKCKGVVSGSKGLEELGNAIPKLILLDIILPDLSGYDICKTIKSDNEYKNIPVFFLTDICKTIKSDNEYKNIPVFFLTAIAGSEVQKNLKETKADGFILKPFNFSDFEVIFDILRDKN